MLLTSPPPKLDKSTKPMAAATILELDPGREGCRHGGAVIDDVVRLEKRIFPKHESLASSFRGELKRRNSGLLCAMAKNGDGEEEVAGYVMYTCATSLCASVTKLAVKESYRRQGHGEALLKAAIERCRKRKVHRVSLHVDPARTAAVSLYQKMGFQIDAAVESYYSPGRDAYRMYLDLLQ